MSENQPNYMNIDSPNKQSKIRYWRRVFDYVIFVGPAVLIFSTFILSPLFDMFRVSLLEWRRLTSPFTFIGWENYLQLIKDPKVIIALQNTSVHLFVMLFIVTPISFMLGYFLSNQLRGYRIFRTIFFSPVMLSAPAMAMIFLGIYLPDGILNYFLRLVGLDSLTQVWLANSNTSLGSVIAMDAWGAIGFYAVLFFAVLSDMPKEIREAAALDGAGYWTIM